MTSVGTPLRAAKNDSSAKITLKMLRRRIIWILNCIVFALPVQAAAHKPHVSLKKQIEAILSQPDLSRGFWGIEISSVATGKALYSLNADKLFTPASNTKLFTTAAALALIGPDYKFRTSIETNGSLDKYGRLSGDLVLIGRGDPTLSGRQMPYNMRTERDADPVKVLEQLADEVKEKGVKYIDGDVVADDSYFAFERYGEGWSQDDLVWAEGAPVSALTINDNVVFVNILPGAHPGDKAFVSLTPFADYYTIDNRLMTMPAGTARKLYINREPGSTQLTLWGSIAADDPRLKEASRSEMPLVLGERSKSGSENTRTMNLFPIGIGGEISAARQFGRTAARCPDSMDCLSRLGESSFRSRHHAATCLWQACHARDESDFQRCRRLSAARDRK